MGSEKQKTIENPDESKKTLVLKYAVDGELSCVDAFRIVSDHKLGPDEVGMYADFLSINLTKCQMGLFGYKPEKKTVKPASSVSLELKKAIENKLEEGKLFCNNAWDIASDFGVGKMDVSCACESMGIKLKKCQLGAF